MRLAIGGEFHQHDPQKIYTITQFVGGHICFYDDVERVTFFKLKDQLASESNNSDNAVKVWNQQTSLTGCFFGFKDLIALSACSARHWRLVDNILASLPDALQPDGVQVGQLDAFRPFAVEL